MNNKVVQVIVTVVLGFILSSGVAIIEESRSAKSFADNNQHIREMGGMSIDLPYLQAAYRPERVFSLSLQK